MRDSTIHASKAVNSGLLDSSENDAVTPAVANPTLSETVALLIESWSSMTPRQKAWLNNKMQGGPRPKKQRTKEIFSHDGKYC
ncbi:MAG: hypothetical protein HOF72_12325 [Planctomycetaceae bacterium]|jgi:hypothetical protein|nr:hypothetical protein [Planctomycetaceae bacterium]MBT4011473.1 hypothetical protein [Planctomycetaceae bacterium]MBT4725026.1 hypothetical protein [Planctomycetaceae bacterium]MBT5124738.1 hypothetical protein [Planctomycetaceae bacterium]MBT5597715.1 hypothetical protein [Planctomycetaceae bacterium]